MSKKIYEMVTEKILSQLKEGVVPWRMPWTNFNSVNWKTQKPYRGINAMILEGGEYASFKQVAEAGGKVKKGERGQIVVFWKPMVKEDKDTGEKERFFLLRYYKVFNVATQCEGIEPKRENKEYEHTPIEEAERIVQGFQNGPKMTYASGKAAYHPLLDLVTVPPMKDYKIAEEYYCTLFHELAHSTGHQSRLARPGIIDFSKFGDQKYSFEELVAEFTAAMLCGVSRIDHTTIENSAAYIASWAEKLKENPMWAIQAAGKAQRAADHMLGISYDEKEDAA